MTDLFSAEDNSHNDISKQITVNEYFTHDLLEVLRILPANERGMAQGMAGMGTATHILLLHHLADAALVLLGDNGKLSRLLVLELLDGRLLLGLGRRLQDLIFEGFVLHLPRLHRLVVHLAYLRLLRLHSKVVKGNARQKPTAH